MEHIIVVACLASILKGNRLGAKTFKTFTLIQIESQIYSMNVTLFITFPPGDYTASFHERNSSNMVIITYEKLKPSSSQAL